MATNFVQEGKHLTLAAPYNRTSGQGALVGAIFGVSLGTVLSTVDGEFAIEGVWDLAKTASQGWSQGADVYWDDTNKRCDNSVLVGPLIGTATEAVAGGSGDIVGRVRLNGAAPPVIGSALVSNGDVFLEKTLTSPTPSTERLLRAALTLTPSTTMAVAGSGSLAGSRGEIILTAAKSFTEGFLYGAQGKVTMNGILAEGAAARIAGVLGQVDLSTGTLTAGQVSAVWGDLQGNPTLTVNDQLYVGRFTNSMSAGKKAQAFQLLYGAADFFFEAAADGGTADWDVVAAVGGSQSHKLKVLVNGTTFYIPLHTA